MTYTRDRLHELLGDDEAPAHLLDPVAFDAAVIGVCERAGGMRVAAYDRTMVIDVLARDMPREEAEEWFEFNILPAYMGEGTPVFIDMRPME
jgi:hypothetical protein